MCEGRVVYWKGAAVQIERNGQSGPFYHAPSCLATSDRLASRSVNEPPRKRKSLPRAHEPMGGHLFKICQASSPERQHIRSCGPAPTRLIGSMLAGRNNVVTTYQNPHFPLRPLPQPALNWRTMAIECKRPSSVLSRETKCNLSIPVHIMADR